MRNHSIIAVTIMLVYISCVYAICTCVVDYKNRFGHLQETQMYDEKHDAEYDEITGKWLESQCSDPECEFCVDRPESHPLPTNGMQEALKHYANEKNWSHCTDKMGFWEWTTDWAWQDGPNPWDIAKEALNEKEY